LVVDRIFSEFFFRNHGLIFLWLTKIKKALEKGLFYDDLSYLLF